MTLDLPYPPSVNHYWARNRDGGVRVDEAGVRYQLAVKAKVAARRLLGEVMPFDCKDRLRVLARAHPPDRRRRDLDNTLKALLDSLKEAGAYPDDEQIDDLRIVRGPLEKGGRVVVTIEEIKPSRAPV